MLIPILLLSTTCLGQADSTQWLRGFPITDYMVNLDDSTVVVQLEMPEDIKLKDKQLGMMFGTYRSTLEDAVQKGYGRCYLIKGVYHYFAIGHIKANFRCKKGISCIHFTPNSNLLWQDTPNGKSFYPVAGCLCQTLL